MPDGSTAAGEDALSEARATIARQAAELAQLRRDRADAEFASELRALVALAAATGQIASPVPQTRLLEMIVETAAQVIGARSASLFLVDEAAQELTFEVALGPKAAAVRSLRVPLGHGIAGLVASSGQPMAISDAQSDPRQAADIARTVDYVPQSILCVPLLYRDRVIGVLELLDKERAPSFSTGDMTTLGLFANQAAVAIIQSRTHDNAVALLGELLASLDGGANVLRDALRDRVYAFAARLDAGEDPAYREALELALLVREIVWRGDREFHACRTLLQGFADYLGARPEASYPGADL